MFALHAQHRELENRRKREFCYKKVAAKRFVKVLDRLGRKQSELQIFPLIHTLGLSVQGRESSTTAATAAATRQLEVHFLPPAASEMGP